MPFAVSVSAAANDTHPMVPWPCPETECMPWLWRSGCVISFGISASDPGGIVNGSKGVGVPLKLSGSLASRVQLNRKRKRPFDKKPTSPMRTSPNSRDGSGAQRGCP